MQQDNRDKRRNDCLSGIRVIVYFEILPNSTCRLRFTTWYILLISGMIFVIGHRITVTSKFISEWRQSMQNQADAPILHTAN